MKNTIATDPQKFSESSLRPLPHLTPHIRISPFSAREWSALIQVNEKKRSPSTTDPGFWLKDAVDFKFYGSGRAAILACLKHLRLKRSDEALIVKTTSGPYISSCVTKTIEKICPWSQTFSAKTKLVLVIHEFGFPCPVERVKPYQKLGLPILEDCAYALGSRLEQSDIGNFGDYAIYSLPKYYPLPYGGILAAREKINIARQSLDLSMGDIDLIKQTLNNASRWQTKWNQIRRQNWLYFTQQLLPQKIKSYFQLEPRVIPGVFWVTLSKKSRGDQRKISLNTAGVEATEYYGQEGFYFPVHQFLTEYEKQYILYHFLNYKN